MAQCIITRKNGGNALKELGFINVPSGTWVFKTGTKDITAKDDSIIPIAVKLNLGSTSITPSFGGRITGGGNKNINDFKCGNWYYGFNNGYGTANFWAGASAENIFVPLCYGMDLTATQDGFTSGTLTCWLEKK